MDVSFLVSCESGRDLGMCKIQEADKKPIEDYCRELSKGSKNMRANKDVSHKKRGLSLAILPTLYFFSITFSFIEIVLHCVGYIACAIGLSTKFLGVTQITKLSSLTMLLVHV